VCALACSIVLVLVPAEQLAASNAPFALAAEQLFGPGAGYLVAVFAAISAYGALNGWILLQGELPSALAREGLFPRPFGRLSSRGAPVTALVAGSLLVSALVLMNLDASLIQVFRFMILLSTTACLVAYLACSLALLVLVRRGEVVSRRAGWLAAAGALGGAYSLWAIYGAGRDAPSLAENPTLWGAVLLVLALPVYDLMRRAARGA